MGPSSRLLMPSKWRDRFFAVRHSFALLSAKADKWLHKTGDFLEQNLTGKHRV